MIVRFGIVALAVSSLALSLVAPARAEEHSDEQTKRFTALEQSLSGVALEGYSTDSKKQPDELREDRYELVMVKHLQGDNWLVQSRFSYGGKDLVLPLTLPIRWAGDTPVISLDKFTVPGLGEFDARVMIYQDHYAGYWSGAGHAGHIFGAVKRLDAANTK